MANCGMRKVVDELRKEIRHYQVWWNDRTDTEVLCLVKVEPLHA